MQHCKAKVTVWHMSGEKYLGFLESICDVKFINPHFLRHLLGKGPFAISKKNYKLLKLDQVNIVCLAPFDPNIIYFCLLKSLIFKDYSLILHTSYPDHARGKMFKYFIFKWLWLNCVNRYFDLVITPIPAIASDLRSFYSVPVKVIVHPIILPKPDQRFTLPVINDKLRVGFLGEKTEKKGYTRLLKLAQMNPGIDFFCAGPGSAADVLPNLFHLSVLKKESVTAFLSGIDLLVVPSKRTKTWEELFGIVIIEAVSLNCKVIATDHLGPRMLQNDIKNLTLLSDHDDEWQQVNLERVAQSSSETEVNLHKYQLGSVLDEWAKLLNNF